MESQRFCQDAIDSSSEALERATEAPNCAWQQHSHPAGAQAGQAAQEATPGQRYGHLAPQGRHGAAYCQGVARVAVDAQWAQDNYQQESAQQLPPKAAAATLAEAKPRAT